MAYDSARKRTVLFGGGTVLGLQDTWEWDGRDWKETARFSTPPRRSFPAMAYDSASGGMVLFGGSECRGSYCSNPIYYGDTWLYWSSGVSRFGASSPGCNGQLVASATSRSQIGNTAFSVRCTNAPKNSGNGVVLLGPAPWSPPMVALGVSFLVNLIPPVAVLPALSDSAGTSIAPLPIPSVGALVGINLFVQFLWINPKGELPCPPLRLSSSDGLRITIQP